MYERSNRNIMFENGITNTEEDENNFNWPKRNEGTYAARQIRNPSQSKMMPRTQSAI